MIIIYRNKEPFESGKDKVCMFFNAQNFLELVNVLFDPFMCWTLKDFISEGVETRSGRGYVLDLKSSLLKLKFSDKNNDLYQFKQVIIIIVVVV